MGAIGRFFLQARKGVEGNRRRPGRTTIVLALTTALALIAGLAPAAAGKTRNADPAKADQSFDEDAFDKATGPPLHFAAQKDVPLADTVCRNSYPLLGPTYECSRRSDDAYVNEVQVLDSMYALLARPLNAGGDDQGLLSATWPFFHLR